MVFNKMGNKLYLATSVIALMTISTSAFAVFPEGTLSNTEAFREFYKSFKHPAELAFHGAMREMEKFARNGDQNLASYSINKSLRDAAVSEALRAEFKHAVVHALCDLQEKGTKATEDEVTRYISEQKRLAIGIGSRPDSWNKADHFDLTGELVNLNIEQRLSALQIVLKNLESENEALHQGSQASQGDSSDARKSRLLLFKQNKAAMTAVREKEKFLSEVGKIMVLAEVQAASKSSVSSLAAQAHEAIAPQIAQGQKHELGSRAIGEGSIFTQDAAGAK